MTHSLRFSEITPTRSPGRTPAASSAVPRLRTQSRSSP